MFIQKIKARLKLILNVPSLGIADRLLPLHSKPADRKPVCSELRRKICQDLGEDVELLGRLAGRDLSEWLEEKPRA